MASIELRRGALSAYRSLLGTIHATFHGDALAIQRCRAAARDAFVQNAAEKDAAKIQKMIADVYEARDFLASHIAQARMNDAGRYELKLSKEHGDKDSKIDVQDAKNAAAGKDKKEGCCGGGCG